MVTSTSTRVAALLLAMLPLAGCGGSGGGAGEPDAAGTSAAESGAAVVSTAETDTGPIVVDGAGRTVYVFDEDTAGSGASACSGECAQMWPAVSAESDRPQVDGVAGQVATIPRDDGTEQVTLDGRPLYTFAGDSEPGDVTGQGVDGVWWTVSPDGTVVREAPAVPDAPAY